MPILLGCEMLLERVAVCDSPRSALKGTGFEHRARRATEVAAGYF